MLCLGIWSNMATFKNCTFKNWTKFKTFMNIDCVTLISWLKQILLHLVHYTNFKTLCNTVMFPVKLWVGQESGSFLMWGLAGWFSWGLQWSSWSWKRRKLFIIIIVHLLLGWRQVHLRAFAIHPWPYDRRMWWTLHFNNSWKSRSEFVCGPKLPQGPIGEFPNQTLAVRGVSLIFILIH